MDEFERDTKREELRKQQEFKAEQFKEDFKRLMAEAWGRRLIFKALETSGVFRTTFIESESRKQYMALAMAHAEGCKNMGYRLMAHIQAYCPEQYMKMMKENANG